MVYAGSSPKPWCQGVKCKLLKQFEQRENGYGDKRFQCKTFAPIYVENTPYVLAKLSCCSLYSHSPELCPNSLPLTQGIGWVYFLLEVFSSTLELAGRRSLKSISKQFFIFPIGDNPLFSTSVPAAVAWVETDF